MGIAVALGLVVALPGAGRAQATCGFVLGFARLRELVGADVLGPCLDDQRTVLNGNAEQRTANGLLVWRMSDNWIAFTDGQYTWIEGPDGLERRSNAERLAWESAPT